MIQNLSERSPNDDELLNRHADTLSSEIRVMMPARVVSINEEKQTIVAQPLIRERVFDRETGTARWVTIENLVDVPISFYQGGNIVLTMPIAVGDECALIFSDLCIDAWWFSGGVQNQPDIRRHDLSDAIAVFGINSQPNIIPNLSLTATELRTRDGVTKISLQDGIITLQAAAVNIVATTSTWHTSGAFNIVGDLSINGELYSLHEHSGVHAGSDISGPVV